MRPFLTILLSGLLKVLKVVGFVLLILWVGQIQIDGKQVGHWWVDFAENSSDRIVQGLKNSNAYQSLFVKKSIRLSKNEPPASNLALPADEEVISEDQDSLEEQASLMKILE